ncbi:methyltransferase-like protein 27 [Antedon mediterranea]|uniref:methyltransferase-like protein 27 n=1 Tax=Antedon mediterranea TaxID=105859 RepID=UPI003AF71A0D
MAHWTKEHILAHLSTLKDRNTQEKLEQFFDDLAPNYDKMAVTSGYVGPSVTSTLLQKYVTSKEAWIMDIASGTGLVGECLANSGYTNIDAVDGSASSIEEALKKNVYTNLYVQWLGGDNKLNIENDTYDAIVCTGAFAANQLKSDVFPDFIRITKPGGYILINMRTQWLELEASYAEGKLEGDMVKLENDGKWKLVEKHNYDGDESALNLVTFIHKVC